MNPMNPFSSDKQDAGPEQDPDADLWFLPGPPESGEDQPAYDPWVRGEDGRQAGADVIVQDWARAEAGCAARLARLAGRLGALDDRLRRGPEGWRHRLALIEAAELSWFMGDRVGPDRLALWLSLRLSGVQDDASALARVGWAVRRLTGGPGPEADLAAFLDRRDRAELAGNAEPFAERAEGWLDQIGDAAELHPITRACMGFHLWPRAGLGSHPGSVEDRFEAAVTAGRLAMAEGQGAVFAPLAMAGPPGLAAALRAGGAPADRLPRWLGAMEAACRTAMRQLDDIEAWAARAEAAMRPLSGRTPPALRRVLTDWPLVSAPMAESLTGASRAAVQRNFAWMEAQGLIREVTGQGRFRIWRASL